LRDLEVRVIASLVLAAVLAPQPPPVRTTVSTWVAAHQQAIVTELLDTLAIPNVAADRPNIRRNAEHLQGLLARHGFKAELLETHGNPLVFGAMDLPGTTRTHLYY
jgi:hypothetical protein